MRIAIALFFGCLGSALAAQEAVEPADSAPPVIATTPPVTITPPPVPALDLPPPSQPGLPATPLANGPGFRQIKQPCALDTADVCAKLYGGAGECAAILDRIQTQCRATQALLVETTRATCHARCDYDAANAVAANRMLDLVRKTLEEADPRFDPARLAKLDFLGNLIADSEVELEALQAEIDARRIYIYTNTETGAVIQHAGEFFEPQPPLEFTGDMAAGPSDSQAERKTILTNRIAKARADEQKELAVAPGVFEWRVQAEETWFGTDTRLGANVCSDERAESERLRCRAFCDAQPEKSDTFPGPVAIDICHPVSVFGMLYQPGSRNWLYPPGDVRRTPGHGR